MTEGETMTLEQALQALHERLGNDPFCDCDDCTQDRAIIVQLEEIRAAETQ